MGWECYSMNCYATQVMGCQCIWFILSCEQKIISVYEKEIEMFRT